MRQSFHLSRSLYFFWTSPAAWTSPTGGCPPGRECWPGWPPWPGWPARWWRRWGGGWGASSSLWCRQLCPVISQIVGPQTYSKYTSPCKEDMRHKITWKDTFEICVDHKNSFPGFSKLAPLNLRNCDWCGMWFQFKTRVSDRDRVTKLEPCQVQNRPWGIWGWGTFI